MSGVLPRFGPFGGLPPPYDEFGIKETRPRLPGRRTAGYDLVERMEYLYVRVVKARELRWGAEFDPHAEVKLGSYSCTTSSSWTRPASASCSCGDRKSVV